RTFSHVGIYLGDGRFVHAPAKGGSVRVESMGTAYWSQRFNGARRLVHEDSLPSSLPDTR
ncbi:MAG: C40 family peptidase, partial [Zoogloeaceae bacterium]|nr:C40 family peptidase [Zoogloeaceae bacterium]